MLTFSQIVLLLDSSEDSEKERNMNRIQKSSEKKKVIQKNCLSWIIFVFSRFLSFW